MDASGLPHGLYAETFAIWLITLVAIQVVADIAAGFVPQWALLLLFAGFFISLIVLAWPTIRGMGAARWTDVRQDVGLSRGQGVVREVLAGVACYVLAVPLIVIGALLTLLLMAIAGAMAGTADPFAPAGGPAHPVIEQVLGPRIWPKVQVLMLAVIAAPIVEEIMFRGVLYRNLRGGTRGLGIGPSVIVSALLSGFIFAVIHPQGLLAVPALGALGVAFAIAREWRGSIIAAIVLHALSNGLVMGFLILAIAA